MIQYLRIVCAALCLLVAQQARACDACGSGSVGNGIGLLSQTNYNLVGFNYAFTRFRGQSAGHKQKVTHDFFHRVDLMSRIRLLPKLRVLTFIPYQINYRTGEVPVKVKGLGDISVLVDYMIFSKKNEKYTLRWNVAGGLVLPTGAYELNADEGRRPNGFNTGMGSMGFRIQSVLTWQGEKVGALLSYLGQLPIKNKFQYRFGNQNVISGRFFYVLNKEWGVLSPFVGASAEFVDKDVLYSDFVQDNTGSKALYSILGLQFTKNNLAFSARVLLPVQQNYANNQTKNRFRSNVTAAFLF